MEIDKIKEIIQKNENVKLDFKRDYESNKENSEYIKDIIALANGSVNSIGETAYLIFGIQERQDINNEIYGIQIDNNPQTIQQNFINKLNSYLVNPIQDLTVEEYELESKKVLVIEIPFQGYLLILKRDLQGTQYKKGNLLYRVGEQTQFVQDSFTCPVRKNFEEAIETYTIPKYKIPTKLTTILGEFPNFKGRKKDCIKLTKKLNEHKAVVVHGIGGIGKSSFVSAYLDMHKNEFKYYGFINWTDDIKLNVFNALEVNMKLEDYSDTDKNFDEVLRQLRDLDGQKLLIIDRIEEKEVNYREEEKFIRDILTLIDNDYKIIFTSRFKIKNLNPYPLNSLDKEEAKEIFLTHYKKNTEIEKIYEILQYLDYHPLFVKLVAKTLEVTDFSIDTIIQKFDKGELSKIEFIDEYTMDTTSFNKNLKALFDMQKINEDGLFLLKQFSVLPSIGIEFTFLQKILNKDELLKNKLTILVAHGWLILDNKSYKLHQIIKEYIISEHLANFNEIENIIESFLDLLKNSGDSKVALTNRENLLYLPSIYQFLQKLNVKNELVADLFMQFSNIYSHLGEYSKSLPLEEKALEINETVFGENHPNTSLSYNNLAELYTSLNNYNKAVIFFKKALNIQLLYLGEYNEFTATTYSNLASCYLSIGKYDEAETLSKQALNIRRFLFEEDSLDVAISYNNLAELYSTIGKYKDSLIYFKKALKIQESLDIEHPNIATTYNNLAGLYKILGEYEKSLIYYEKALNIRKKLYGTEHPDTAQSYDSIGGLYHVLEDFDKALSFYKKAMDINKKTFGENHIETAISYNNLAGLYMSTGKYSRVEPLLQKALKIYQERLEDEHIYIANIYNNLGDLNRHFEKYPQAIVLYEKALKINEKILEENHPEIAIIYNNLGTTYFDMKKYQKALSALEKSLNMTRKVLGENHLHTAESYNNLAELYRILQKYEKSKIYFKNAITIWEKELPENHQYLLSARTSLNIIENELTRFIPMQTNKKIGRNNKCLCGSGVKYKKCCGK